MQTSLILQNLQEKDTNAICPNRSVDFKQSCLDLQFCWMLKLMSESWRQGREKVIVLVHMSGERVAVLGEGMLG